MTTIKPAIDELDELVRGVDGVDVLYPARSLIENALALARRGVDPHAGAISMVAGERHSDGLRVTAKIGIGAGESSGKVCCRVHDVIAERLRQKHNLPPVARISVIVASVRPSA